MKKQTYLLPWKVTWINGIEVNYLGSLDSPSMLVFVGRNNSKKKSTSIDFLIQELHLMGISVCWYESKTMQTSKLLTSKYELFCKTRFAQVLQRNPIFETLFRRVIKSFILLAHPKRWDYLLRAKMLGKIYFLGSDLRAFLCSLASKNVFLISHSAGGITSSSIESEFAIKAMACFGYPFKHPDRGHESYRTKHLANLKKPFLILQGANDEYGSSEDARRYALSPSIQIAPLESGHDYDNLSETDFRTTLVLLQDFFRLNQRDGIRHD